ncbi:MAG: molybdopterin-dependent oxidoreductase, partial [Acidobacteria bacterium]|nr:molybdopterin-dependent oxidoreductase [Acidobacteriota bacterium]
MSQQRQSDQPSRTNAAQPETSHSREAQPSHYGEDGAAQAAADVESERTSDQQSSQALQSLNSRNAQSPEEFTGIRIARASQTAGGLGAIVSTVKHSWREMGAGRSLKTLLRVNQKDGFDCPGCAWPEPDGERSHAEFCENGAKAVAEEATTKRVTPEFFREWSIAHLSQQSDFWLSQQGRITHPMVLRRGAEHYAPVSWDEAFQLIATELNALASPDEALFYTSGRTSNEAAFLYQLFVRQYGTNNLPDCSNMCHESSGTALTETIGVGKGTVRLEDFELADAIFIIGQNPGTNHPRMLTTL